jgi:signal transduction histidine kinase
MADLLRTTDGRDLKPAVGFHQALESALVVALDELYAQMRATPEIRSQFADEAQLERAKMAQHQHWLAVLIGDPDPSYVERVARIAGRHAALGLQPSLFMGAYTTVLCSIIRQLQDAPGIPADLIPTLVTRSVRDMGVITEAYIAASEDANRAKSRFLANMSHELRTPLNAIVGYAEMVKEELDQDAPIAKDLDAILDAAKQLLGLINQLLDIAKIEAGAMVLHTEFFDPAALTRATLETVKPIAKQNCNALVFSAAPDLALMEGDRAKLRQCLLNLLSNALKFTKAGSVAVSVSQDPSGAGVVFEVRDTGIGMNAQQLRRIFQPYAQADRLTEQTYGGTGLGLVISKQLAEVMGGTIAVESELGKGTTFTLRLPQAAAMGVTAEDWVGAAAG